MTAAPQSIQPKISETRQHSPLPYRISRGEIFDADGEVVGEIFRTEAWSDGEPVKSEDQATAAFIVEAVNSHARLTERCEQYKGQVKAGSDEIARLTAEIEMLRERNGEWRPIETLPRDGHGYLVCDDRVLGDSHQVVFWDDEAKTEWCLQTSDGPAYHPSSFTHWMPLPSPPALQPKPADETGRVG